MQRFGLKRGGNLDKKIVLFKVKKAKILSKPVLQIFSIFGKPKKPVLIVLCLK